jgi:hypothetical protein
VARLAFLACVAGLVGLTGASALGAGTVTHKAGQYTGKTKEKTPVVFLVGKKRVSGSGVTGKVSCTDVNTGEVKTFRLHQQVDADYFHQGKAWKINRKGRFDGTVHDREKVRGKNRLDLRVAGKVKGKKMSGSFSYKLELTRYSCDSGKHHFTAKWKRKVPGGGR